MERATLTITTRAQLETAFRFAAKLDYPYIVEVRDVKRSDDQNRTMWLWLTAFEEQAELSGKRLTKEQWKTVFMQALGKELEVLPTLDGKSWFPAGFRSSKLTKFEFMDLLTLIDSEAAKRGVTLPITEESEAAETEGAASEKPAADPPSVREPASPAKPPPLTAGQAAVLTEDQAVEYAHQWADYFASLQGREAEDAFCTETSHLGPIFREHFPRAYRLMQAAVFAEKDAA